MQGKIYLIYHKYFYVLSGVNNNLTFLKKINTLKEEQNDVVEFKKYLLNL